MGDRVSQVILLCEDDTQHQLARAYLDLCEQQGQIRPLIASRMEHGGNVGWVMNEFPRQLHACRQRHKKARTLLIVIVDADNFTLEQRRRQLFERVKSGGYEEFGQDEPAVLLIAKRHVETWISALLGKVVTEEEDCKTRNKPKKEDIRKAARALHAWSRPNTTPGQSCVASLAVALPEWRKIC